jgi:hypothetical protein
LGSKAESVYAQRQNGDTKTRGHWWEGRPDELFWLETTDRDDSGRDLNAPQLGEEGQPHWSYDFVTLVEPGDVVVHYKSRPEMAVVGWSRVDGRPYADEVFWGAHGQASGRGPVEPYRRPGWRVGLDGPYLLPTPVTLTRLRELEPALLKVRDELRTNFGDPLYFPFAFSARRALRPTQFYLTKTPRALLLAVPELATVEALARETAPTPVRPAPRASSPGLGTDYRREDEETTTSEREPFDVDPSVVDRGLQAHAKTQNALADFLSGCDVVPRSSNPGEPPFDLGWETNGMLFVAEVKSLTRRNEEKQLRLGLGQVLRYAHQLEAKGKPVRAVLSVEHEPSDGSWLELCGRLGVIVVWPGAFGQRLGVQAPTPG